MMTNRERYLQELLEGRESVKIGAVLFQDGHTEPITNIYFITKCHFQFVMESGMYAYREDVVCQEKLYCDNDPYIFGTIRPRFAKFTEEDTWEEIFTIDTIYVKEEHVYNGSAQTQPDGDCCEEREAAAEEEI